MNPALLQKYLGLKNLLAEVFHFSHVWYIVIQYFVWQVVVWKQYFSPINTNPSCHLSINLLWSSLPLCFTEANFATYNFVLIPGGRQILGLHYNLQTLELLADYKFTQTIKFYLAKNLACYTCPFLGPAGSLGLELFMIDGWTERHDHSRAWTVVRTWPNCWAWTWQN